jgi:hypothetical protein
MKSKALWSLLLVLSFAACHHDDTLNGERPADIIDTDPCPTLYSRILELFPENIAINQQILFADSTQKNVELIKDAEVYVTYLAENAGYRNSIAWYSYSKYSPPTSSSQLDLHVLFPDVSSDILTPGNRLKLQDDKFPAGTIIGFVLIINGWQGKVDFDQPRLYTDFQLNANRRQQHILFMEKTCQELVLAFEDNMTIGDNADADYNDIIFTVEDNNVHNLNTSFNTKNLASW